MPMIGDAFIERLTKEIAKSSGILFGGRVAGKALRLILQVMLARLFGASSYGLYALALSVTSIIQQFSMVGLQNGVVRFVAMYRGEGNKKRVKGILVSALLITFLLSSLTATFLWMFSSYVSQALFNKSELSPILRAFAISLPFYSLMIVCCFAARAFRVMQYDVGIRSIFQPIIHILVTVIFFMFGFEIYGAAIGFLVSAVVSALSGLYFLKMLFPELASRFSPSFHNRKLLRFSIPVFLVGISHLTLNYTDKIMLGYMTTSKDVGLYNAAFRLAVQLSLIIGVLDTAFSPLISDLYNKGKLEELTKLFKIIARWAFSLTLPIFLIISRFPGPLLSLFGPAFSEAAGVLVLLGISYLIAASFGSTSIMLQMTGNQDVELLNTLIILISNIGLNFWLINLYGVFGAAVATGFSVVITNTLKLIEVNFMLDMNPLSLKYWKPILAGLITLLIIAIVKNIRLGGLGIQIVVSLGVYFIILYSLRLYPEDLLILKAMFRRIKG